MSPLAAVSRTTSSAADAAFLARVHERLAPIREEYPFESRCLSLPAGRMHYVDEGPRDAPAVVCVHGNPTWSFAFRRIVRALRGDHRVIALDHIGCGMSDKPHDWTYRLKDHAENLLALVEALDVRDITLVMHDWGGAIGMGFARRAPERVARLFAMNTAAFASRELPLRIAACRIPLFGPFLVRRLNAFAGLAPRMAVADRSKLSPKAREGLLLPYDSARNRIAIQRFVEDIPMGARHPSWPELAAIDAALASFRDRPVALCWGERDWCFTPRIREEWQRRFPAARVTRVEHAGHYVFEEAPEEVERALRELLAERLTRTTQCSTERSTVRPTERSAP